MLTSVNAAEDTYFKIDLTGTPLDWYRGFAMNYMGSDSALYYFRLAETQNPYHVQVISDIGATLENKGKHEEAISYLKRALNIIPRYREAHYNLAIAYYNTKRPADALTEINQSYAVSDEYRIALEAILVMNAESLRDSLPMNESKIQLEKFISDIKVLKDIHKISMDRNLSFTRLLKDSCESKIAIN
jgi:tetratricopeptide (TPR) repeat protein